MQIRQQKVKGFLAEDEISRRQTSSLRQDMLHYEQHPIEQNPSCHTLSLFTIVFEVFKMVFHLISLNKWKREDDTFSRS